MKPTKHILIFLILVAVTLLTGRTSLAHNFTTDTLHSGIYAFTFDQQGLMAGLGLQGSKIMRLD